MNFSFYHTVWKLRNTLWKFRNFTATVFSQKFRQINILQKNITINWFDGKKLDGSEFLVFPHCTVAEIHSSHTFLQKFREIYGFDMEIIK